MQDLRRRLNLTHQGFRVTQLLEVPRSRLEYDDVLAEADAVVIALKIRTLPVEQAVSASLEALDALRELGCARYYFKYCSTFDSTPEGNIGPVAEALMEALGQDATIFCPAFPRTGRTVYQGHLFVDETPLHESGMRQHPLTPMTDSDLGRWLARQTAHEVGLVRWQKVREGPQAVRSHIAALREAGKRAIVTDAVEETDLRVLASATSDLALITGSSGLALGLNAPYSTAEIGENQAMPVAADSPRLVLAGSTSATTRTQVTHAKRHCPSVKLDPLALERDYDGESAALMERCRTLLGEVPLVVYSAETSDDLVDGNGERGPHVTGELIEQVLADLAAEMYTAGVRSFIVAGGETSGAVAASLDARALRIGPQVAPGVPWTAAVCEGAVINLILKSGNFGTEDMFTTAWGIR